MADPFSPSRDDLAGELLAHLASEAAVLEDALPWHEELNRALRAADPAAVEAAAARLAVGDPEATRAERAALIRRTAGALGLTGEVTLRAIAARLPWAAAAAVADIAERLRRSGLAVANLTRRNAALAQTAVAFVQERIAGITGEAPPARYGADGRALGPRRGPLLHAQG